MLKRTIEIEGPYDFDRGLRRLAFNPLSNIDLEQRLIKVPLVIGTEKYVASVRAIGTIDEPAFIVTSENNDEKIVDSISDIFRWNVPLSDIASHFKGSVLEPVFSDLKGTPLIKEFSAYRSLTTSIIHQQLNLSFAHTLTKRFVHNYGKAIDGVWFYPEPEVVAALSPEDLREHQFSGRKAEYVIGVSERIAIGELRFDEIEEMDDETAVKELVKIRGVGPWTAQSLLLFGLGRNNLFPVGDVGIQNAVKQLLNRDEKPKPDELEEMAMDWAPFKSYAALYLWESLGNQTVKTS